MIQAEMFSQRSSTVLGLESDLRTMFESSLLMAFVVVVFGSSATEVLHVANCKDETTDTPHTAELTAHC